MPEKIVISFDDETPEKPEKSEEKIIIDFKPAEKKEKAIKIKDTPIDFQFRGNTYLTSADSNELTYPAGLENGFGKIYSLNFRDTFLNSLLLNNKYVILASSSGNVYFIDRYKGELSGKQTFEKEAFEKTGIVIGNRVYINSVKTLYGFDDNLKENILYKVQEGYYAWTNLNRVKDKIVFLEFSPEKKSAYLVSYDRDEISKSDEFFVNHFLSDSIITDGSEVYVFCDKKIMRFDIHGFNYAEYSLNFGVSPDTYFFMTDGKIYFNNLNNELFYFDTVNEDIKFTGIKCSYINSLGGVNDNIFIGLINGWQLYKTSGMPVYTYDDIAENKIESVNKHMLAVSKDNKIIFHNLDKFQEAEGFSVTSDNAGFETDEVISARIGEDAVFVLSRNGILEAFNNDKLNIVL